MSGGERETSPRFGVNSVKDGESFGVPVQKGQHSTELQTVGIAGKGQNTIAGSEVTQGLLESRVQGDQCVAGETASGFGGNRMI